MAKGDAAVLVESYRTALREALARFDEPALLRLRGDLQVVSRWLVARGDGDRAKSASAALDAVSRFYSFGLEVGDDVRIVVDNQLPMGTDIHWHGVKVPNNMDGVAPITQPLVESGETFVYEFTTRESAIAMYHAHHHAQMQVPNGLFGAFIVGETPIPDGQTVSGVEIPRNLEIAQEIPMVLNDAGVIGLSLNAKSFPATEPYTGKVGDWVVVHYFNEGVLVHPMHQHQFPQLVFAKDGIPLDHPYWADTVPVAPGERYSVLFQLEDPGVWVWHCHILNHVESETGMFGMVTAWIVEE